MHQNENYYITFLLILKVREWLISNELLANFNGPCRKLLQDINNTNFMLNSNGVLWQCFNRDCCHKIFIIFGVAAGLLSHIYLWQRF